MNLIEFLLIEARNRGVRVFGNQLHRNAGEHELRLKRVILTRLFFGLRGIIFTRAMREITEGIRRG